MGKTREIWTQREDIGSVTITHTVITATFNSSSGESRTLLAYARKHQHICNASAFGSDPLFWPPWARHARGILVIYLHAWKKDIHDHK